MCLPLSYKYRRQVELNIWSVSHQTRRAKRHSFDLMRWHGKTYTYQSFWTNKKSRKHYRVTFFSFWIIERKFRIFKWKKDVSICKKIMSYTHGMLSENLVTYLSFLKSLFEGMYFDSPYFFDFSFSRIWQKEDEQEVQRGYWTSVSVFKNRPDWYHAIWPIVLEEPIFCITYVLAGFESILSNLSV